MPAKPSTPRLYHRAGAPIYWAFMEGPRQTFWGDSGDVSDLIGNTQALNRVGGCTWAEGPDGPYLAFDGTGYCNFVDRYNPRVPPLNLNGNIPFTVSARLKTTYTSIQEWFGFGDISSGHECELLFGFPSAGDCTVFVDGGGLTSVPVSTDGLWHHITFRSDGSTVSFFEDGLFLGSGAMPITVANENFAIGASGPQDYPYPWNGGIDDLRIFNYALTDADIAREYNDPFWRLRRPSRMRRYASLAGAGPITLSPGGIASAEAFGALSLSLGSLTIAPGGIASAEAFGSPSLARGSLTITPGGTTSSAAFGAPSLALGGLTLFPPGIASAAAFGSPALAFGGFTLFPAGIASGEAFGAPSLAFGGLTLFPPGIASAAAFGTPALSYGNFTLFPPGIASGEAFGVPSLVTPLTPVFIRAAVAAALASSAAIAAVVGTNITPVSPREKKLPPSLTYQLIANVRERTLDGPLGKSRARFRFTCRSKSQTDCQAVSEAIRQLLDGYTSNQSGPLGGLVWVDWCHQLDEPDERIPDVDGSDAGTFTTSDDYLIRYREPKPVR